MCNTELACNDMCICVRCDPRFPVTIDAVYYLKSACIVTNGQE